MLVHRKVPQASLTICRYSRILLGGGGGERHRENKASFKEHNVSFKLHFSYHPHFTLHFTFMEFVQCFQSAFELRFTCRHTLKRHSVPPTLLTIPIGDESTVP